MEFSPNVVKTTIDPDAIRDIKNQVLGNTEPLTRPTNPFFTDADQEVMESSGKGVLTHFKESAPILFGRHKHPAWMGDIYKDQSIFLILSGPSFMEIIDEVCEPFGKTYREVLSSPGVMTASVNNAITSFRTNLWFTNDSPHQFVKSAWMDPTIMKFAPMVNLDRQVFDSDPNVWDYTQLTPYKCSNTWYYCRNENFNAKTFLFEDTVNWGSAADYGGKRSVMLVAMRLLYHLGFKNVFLVGCDFHMSEEYTYHFHQARHESSIKSNNSTYAMLQNRFTELYPIFQEVGFNVYNCNFESKLNAFPYASIDDALKHVLDDFPDTENENTEGLYDREYRKRQEDKRKKENKDA